MNLDEKIISYLEHKLPENEMKDFEKLISHSDELKKEIAEYKKLFNLIDETKNPVLDPGYKVETLNKFRNNLASKVTKKYRPRFIYATSSIVAAFTIVLILNFLNSDTQIKTEDIPETELMETLIDNGYSNFSDLNPSLIDSLYQSEISLETKSDTEYLISFNINNYDKASEVLSEEEENEIYKSLIDKKFF